jgi:acyl-CoA thioester hydrolase
MEHSKHIIEAQTKYTIHANDCDILGHLNNAKYVELFHSAREDHLIDIYGYDMAALVRYEAGFVVGSQQIFYFRSAVCYERVIIQSSVIKLEDTKIMVEFVMFNETKTEIKSIMWTEYISIRKSTGKTGDIPEERKEFFKNLLNTKVIIEDGILKRHKALKESLKGN